MQMTAGATKTWKEFRLIMSDPPRVTDHFSLIKKHLIPHVEAVTIRKFLILNYFDQYRDLIRFRVYAGWNDFNKTRAFLGGLQKDNHILRYEESDWDPARDAADRIRSAGEKFGIKFENWILLPGKNVARGNYSAKLEQLTTIFADVVGQCTKTFYNTIESKPQDVWVMSLFLHLVLNSLDFSGPDPPSEEFSIRECPVL